VSDFVDSKDWLPEKMALGSNALKSIYSPLIILALSHVVTEVVVILLTSMKLYSKPGVSLFKLPVAIIPVAGKE